MSARSGTIVAAMIAEFRGRSESGSRIASIRLMPAFGACGTYRSCEASKAINRHTGVALTDVAGRHTGWRGLCHAPFRSSNRAKAAASPDLKPGSSCRHCCCSTKCGSCLEDCQAPPRQ